MAQSLKGKPGKSDYQRLRAYLVMQFFLKNADERHPVSMQDILAPAEKSGKIPVTAGKND